MEPEILRIPCSDCRCAASDVDPELKAIKEEKEREESERIKKLAEEARGLSDLAVG